MTTAEKVIAALANLPDEQQAVVLDFVEFLNQKQNRTTNPESQLDQTHDAQTAQLRETLRQVAGCMQDAPSDLSTNPVYMEGFGE